MTARVIILSTAEDDLDAGARFYEAQGEGLGDHFLATLKLELRSLTVHGGVHRVQYGYHRAVSQHFPYAIFYRVKDDAAFVHAVLDCRRDPRKSVGGCMRGERRLFSLAAIPGLRRASPEYAVGRAAGKSGCAATIPERR